MRDCNWSGRLVPALVVAVGCCLAAVSPAFARGAGEVPLKGAEARAHVGEDRTVCGKVSSARYLDSSGRQPTFLNFDKPYPDHTFTVVIFGPDREKFGEPEKAYRGKAVCATGRIEEYRGQPQIVVRDPAKLTLQPQAQ